MIFVSVPLILTLILLGVIAIVFLSASTRAKARNEEAVNEWRDRTEARYIELHDDAIREIADAGASPDHVFRELLQNLAQISPIGKPSFTEDQIKDHCREELRRRHEQSNSKLLVQAFGSSAVVLALGVVTAIYLYNEGASDTASFESGVPLSTSIAPLPSLGTNTLPPLEPLRPDPLPPNQPSVIDNQQPQQTQAPPPVENQPLTPIEEQSTGDEPQQTSQPQPQPESEMP